MNHFKENHKMINAYIGFEVDSEEMNIMAPTLL